MKVRVQETAKLPAAQQKLFYAPWLVLFPGGWAAGVFSREAAVSLARRLKQP